MSGRGKGKQLRADAQRNHELIVATTRSLLPVHGPGITMEKVAHACGVGVGTLYRRFGSREALISAAAEAAFQRVKAHADAIAEHHGDAWETFSDFIRLTAPDLKTVASLSVWYPEEWGQIEDTATERNRRRSLMEILERLVHDAQESGVMRPDVTTDDVAVLLSLTLRPVPGRPGDTGERHLMIMLDGLRDNRSAAASAVSDAPAVVRVEQQDVPRVERHP